MMWGHYWNGAWPMMGWWGLGGHIIGILILVLLIVFIIRFAGMAGHGYYRGSGESALDILKKRYAKGEISKDDFEKMKKDIKD